MTTDAQTSDAATAQPSNSVHMIAVLGGVAMLSGFLLVTAYQLTLPRILHNRRVALEKAVFHVLPGAESRATFVVDADGVTRVESEESDADNKVYAGYDADGALVGIAIEAAGQGYQDTVRVLFGYSPARDCIIGYRLLESKETPGLGDRIGKDPSFLANFDQLDTQLNAEGTGLIHAIATVKHGAKSDPWQIDGVTGATISSKAVGAMLNRRCNEILPIIKQNLSEFEKRNLSEFKAES